MNPIALDEGRPVWNSAKALILTVAGGAAGYGALFRLPLMFVAFGVGNFYIAYIITVFLVAYPVAVLETFVGAHYRLASAGSLAAVHPKAIGLGQIMPMIGAVLVSIYASVLLSWTVYPFFLGSFSDAVGYKLHTTQALWSYWSSQALLSSASEAEVLLIPLVLWTFASLLAARGIQTIMVAVYFTVSLPLLALLALTVYAMAVSPLAEMGRFLLPTASGFANLLMWGNALGQALVSLQAGNGNLIAFGSFCRRVHNPFHIVTAVLWQAVLVTTIVGLITACAMTQMDWSSVVAASYAAGFVVPLEVYVSLLIQVSATGPLGAVFFAFVLLLGVEGLAIGVQVFYSLLWDVAVAFRGKYLGFAVGFTLFVLSVPLMLNASYNVITAIDQAALVVLLPICVGLEAILAGYFWADQSILQTLRERALPPGVCPTVQAFLSIAYHHSIGKMHAMLEAQGRSYALSRVFPVFIKFVVPVATLVLAVGSAVVLTANLAVLGVAGYVTGASIVLGALLFVVVQAFATRAVHQPLPWDAITTVQTAHAMSQQRPADPPVDGGPSIALDSLELRVV